MFRSDVLVCANFPVYGPSTRLLAIDGYHTILEFPQIPKAYEKTSPRRNALKSISMAGVAAASVGAGPRWRPLRSHLKT